MAAEAHADDLVPISSVDVPLFRARRRATLLLPYENLEMNPRHTSAGFHDLVERRLREGYERDGESIVSLVGPIDWAAFGRSFSVRLHSWEPITELLMHHSLYGEARPFDAARAFAFNWIERFQPEAFVIGPDPAKIEPAIGPMPWYDMAVGRRAYRLAYILDVMARDARHDDEVVLIALRSLLFHLLLLSRDDFFRAGHNHGFYQAFGELAATRRFRDDPLFADREASALRRVEGAIDQQFHSSGIHREHSPDYHFMVMGSLIGARASGLVASDPLCERIASIESAMSWLMQPNGMILTFGDTAPRNFRVGEYYPDRFQDSGLRYQLSGGKLGAPSPGGVLSLPEEGYAIARSEATLDSGEAWWYLAQIASFHSRAHKHADDLSFVWSDRGSEILIDPGRYAYGAKTEPGSELAKQGFWYADPKRIYVESTRAHNTVEIDGRSYDRRRKPYGSALRYAGEQGGIIVTECDVHHFQTARHWRVLVMVPGRFLLVIDWLYDRTGQKHDFRQHFHFHPIWSVISDPTSADDMRILASRLEHGGHLAVIPLLGNQGHFQVVRGQKEPALLGWYSDKPYSLIPSTALVAEQRETDYAVFATLFTFATNAKPWPGKAVVRKSMRPSLFPWEEDDGFVAVEVGRGEGGNPVSVVLHRKP